jgi:chromosome partitioning protein
VRRVIFNQKGGVGKTSITCNLAAISANRGKRTLVIDLDTQANSTHYLLGNAEYDVSIADFLDQSVGFFGIPKSANEFVYDTQFDNLFIMPACKRLPEIEHKLESRYKIFALKKAFKELEEFYDEIYIDTPPALNFYTKSALIGADRVLIPFDCDAFSRSSLASVSSAIYEIKEDHNESLSIEGVIVNQFQPRAKLPKQLVNELIEDEYPILASMLTSSVKMRESHQQASPLIYYAPKHNLTKQFEMLYEELNE